MPGARTSPAIQASSYLHVPLYFSMVRRSDACTEEGQEEEENNIARHSKVGAYRHLTLFSR